MAIKQFTWQGKTEEEIRRMDLKAFIPLVTARRRRSLLRMTEQEKILLKKIGENQNNIKTHCREMVIVPAMIGKVIRVHNGKEWFPLTITVDMVSHCLGEFSQTRKPVTHSAAGIGATRSSKAVSAR